MEIKFFIMNEITPENVKPKDWISVGARSALVCKIYENNPNKIEVVYLDRNRAINDDLIFKDGKWVFLYDTGGGYADNYGRLAEFVSILRSRE